MAKGITIKAANGEKLYPKTVTELVYDKNTNRTLSDILGDQQGGLDRQTKYTLVQILKAAKFKKSAKRNIGDLITYLGLEDDATLSNLDEVDLRNDDGEPPKKYSIKEGKDINVKKSIQGDKPIVVHLKKEDNDNTFSNSNSIVWAVDKPELCRIQKQETNCEVTPLYDGRVNLYFIYNGVILANTLLFFVGYGSINNNVQPPIKPTPVPPPPAPEDPPYLALSPTTFAVSKSEPTFVINADTHNKAKTGEIKWYVSGGGNSTITPIDANRARVQVTDDGQVIVKAVYKGLEVFSYGSSSGFAAARPQEPTISLNPINARLNRERGQVEIVATVTPEPSGSDTIRWSIPNENTILIGANGKTCRVAAKNNGTETITATYKGKEATATIVVEGYNDIHFETRESSMRGKNNITNRLVVSPKNDDPNKQIQYTLEGDEYATMSVNDNVVTLTPKKNGHGKVIAKYDDLTKAEFTFVFEGVDEGAVTVKTSGRNLVTSSAQANGEVIGSGFSRGGLGKYSVALTLSKQKQYAITNLPTKKLADSLNIALQWVKGAKKITLQPSDYHNTTMAVGKGDNTFTTFGVKHVNTNITKDNPLVFSTPYYQRNGYQLKLYITSSIGEKDIFNEIKVEEVVE